MFSSAYIIATNRCNMRCSYCYERDFFKDNFKDMSLETMNRTSEFLVEHGDKHSFAERNNNLSIFYFGGEPTLAWATIKENIKYNKELEKKSGLKFGHFFLTNGYKLPEPKDEFFQMLKSKDIIVQVSLDGCKQAHDTTRGHFEEIVKNIAEIQVALNHHIIVRMTVTPENIRHAFESFRAMASLSCTVALTLAMETLWTEEHTKIAEEQFTQIMNYYKKISQRTALTFNIASKICKGGFAYCHAGNNMVGVDVDGSIYPCHRFPFHPNKEENWKMGDVFTGVKKYPKWEGMYNQCDGCEVNICHPCPSALLLNDIKLPNTYCDVYKTIQKTCTPIAKDVHAYNLEQIMLKYVQLATRQVSTEKK